MTADAQPRPQALVRDLLQRIVSADLAFEVSPEWLLRPGRHECRERWSLVSAVYRRLTGLELPPTAPPRERRRVDAIATYSDGRRQIIEIDERQHFTGARALTLAEYPHDEVLGFPIDVWAAEAKRREGKEPGGGFARPCPPLFPGPGGRHRQRAFRDLLADLLPSQYGWLPTIRIADFEVAGAALATDSAAMHLLVQRGVPAEFVR